MRGGDLGSQGHQPYGTPFWCCSHSWRNIGVTSGRLVRMFEIRWKCFKNTVKIFLHKCVLWGYVLERSLELFVLQIKKTNKTEQLDSNAGFFCPYIMIWHHVEQRSWEVVTRWHLDIVLSVALSPSPLPLVPFSSPARLTPSATVCAKYTSDVRVFYFYWMRTVCNAFTSIPASC